MEEKTLVRPNQGIRRSARNSVIVGLIFWLLAGLIFWLFMLLLRWTTLNALRYGLSYGLLSALLIGLPNGGTAYIQHRILRLLLRYTGSISSHYTCFLNSAAEQLLLRKVGGGYIFIHRLLLEHFATLNSAPGPTKLVEPSKWKERVFKITPLLLARVGLVIGIVVVSIHLWVQFHHSYPPADANARQVLDSSLGTNRGIWSESTDSWGTCHFINNAYQVTSKGSHREHCPAGKTNFRNFTIEADMTIVQGDDAGLFFRGNQKTGYYYSLWIGQNRTYYFYSSKIGYYKQLVRGHTIAINSGDNQLNQIALVVQGNTFELHINHQYITTVSDPNSTSDQGSIDFGSQSYNKIPTVALFRHVKIWRDK